jgi:hypothetical protein
VDALRQIGTQEALGAVEEWQATPPPIASDDVPF